MTEDTDSKASIGKIEWTDLTVEHAEPISRFYCDVVGWASSPVSMGDYSDFNITLPQSEHTVAGICHARGSNSQLPAQWLIYVRVEDVNTSCEKCLAQGGEVVDGPRHMGSSQFCVIKDPAGAVLALISN